MAIKQSVSDSRLHSTTTGQRSECSYCNGNGFFWATKSIEVATGKKVSYSYTYRCAGCRNWSGIIGERVPAKHPLEIQSAGFTIILAQPEDTKAKHQDIESLLMSVGTRVNPKTDRPAIQRYHDRDERDYFV
jgi:hypothetical protein